MRRNVNLPVLAVLLAGCLLLMGPVPGDPTPVAGSQFLEHRIELINDTGERVSIRIESSDPWVYVESPEYLADGETCVVNLSGGLLGHQTVYAFSPTGRVVAYKRTTIQGPGLLRVPRGNDGATIHVTTLFRRAD
jgi:hypothetical protein